MMIRVLSKEMCGDLAKHKTRPRQRGPIGGAAVKPDFTFATATGGGTYLLFVLTTSFKLAWSLKATSGYLHKLGARALLDSSRCRVVMPEPGTEATPRR